MTATATVTDLATARRSRRAYARARRTAIAYGRWDRGLMDAGPVRTHVARLRAAGMTLPAIAAAAGVSLAAVRVLATGRPDGPATHVRATTAAAILAVRPPAPGPDPLRTALVRHLHAQGWGLGDLRQLGTIDLLLTACAPDPDGRWHPSAARDTHRRRAFAMMARRVVVTALAGMDAATRDRVAVILTRDAGLSPALVGRIVGVSERTVRRAVQRAAASAAA